MRYTIIASIMKLKKCMSC